MASVSPANSGEKGDMGSILGSRRPPGGGNDNSLQYSCLKNSTDRGAWWVAVHGGLKDSDTTEHTCIAQDTASQIGTVPK